MATAVEADLAATTEKMALGSCSLKKNLFPPSKTSSLSLSLPYSPLSLLYSPLSLSLPCPPLSLSFFFSLISLSLPM